MVLTSESRRSLHICARGGGGGFSRGGFLPGVSIEGAKNRWLSKDAEVLSAVLSALDVSFMLGCNMESARKYLERWRGNRPGVSTTVKQESNTFDCLRPV